MSRKRKVNFPLKNFVGPFDFPIFALEFKTDNAEIAQLVEHNLAKVGVASSSLVFRSTGCSNGGIGRHEGLKILWPVMAVRVQVPLRVQSKSLITLIRE